MISVINDKKYSVSLRDVSGMTYKDWGGGYSATDAIISSTTRPSVVIRASGNTYSSGSTVSSSSSMQVISSFD
ncbi:hypothetical protein Q7C36_009993 [Tachysurus vachellii]|uniref:Uncharacterized protein n=1 Tax=Tachysurus vachellii TaxID=175792 RepID=A0AA88SWC4_TACVA|nr:hypothetical protein Q7C36_009993 [Tachysurus vachellii]